MVDELAAWCDECGAFLSEYRYILNWNNAKDFCIDCAMDAARQVLITNGTVSIDQIRI